MHSKEGLRMSINAIDTFIADDYKKIKEFEERRVGATPSDIREIDFFIRRYRLDIEELSAMRMRKKLELDQIERNSK